MNKDKNTTEFVEKIKAIKLSDSSRSRIKQELLDYSRFHSVRVDEVGRSKVQVPKRTPLFTLFKRQKSMTAAIIAIMLIAGGGTSYAAEGAVPGDFLYTVKTEVNENVKSALAISDEAEAKLQANLAKERLEEAEELAVRGELSAEASTELNTRLKSHVDEAESRSDEVEADGNYEASATVRASLEGTLRTYADVLASLNTEVTGNEGSLLVTNIRAYADATAKSQATATVDVSADVRGEVEATIKQADKFIAEVKTKLSRAESKLSVEAHARVEAKITQAVAVQLEAQASLRTEAYQSAYTSTQAAIRISNEASTMIDSMLRLQIDVKVDTDNLIDGLLEDKSDVEIQSDEEVRTDAESSDSTASETDVELDVKTDSSIDTDMIDVEVEANTSVRSGLNL